MTDRHAQDGELDREPNPAQKQEKVEDRPNVSTVTPEDYTREDRASGDKA